jgi:C-terminal processing protease CtpA/Prc
LTAVGKLWFTVKYFHPYLAHRQIDWDNAFADAYPAIVRANTQDEYADAVDSMLATLADPVTRVSRPLPSAPAAKADGPLFRTENKEGVLLVQLVNLSAAENFNVAIQQGAELGKQIDAADATVLDLRVPDSTRDQADVLDTLFSYTDLQTHLFRGVLAMPASAHRFHSGLAAASGNLGAFYYSGIAVNSSINLSSASSAKEHALVFIANRNSLLPGGALALQQAGKAAIYSESPTIRSAIIQTTVVPLGENLTAAIRTSEAVFADGTGELPPTKVASHETILAGTIQEARHFSRHATAGTASAALVPHEQRDRPYADAPLPTVPYRLLAGFQIWGAFQHFFAYRRLIEEDRSAVLTQFIPKLESAQTARDYNFTVAEMLTHVHDSHVHPSSSELMKWKGATTLVQVRAIEGRPVITKICDPSAAKAGLQVGDVILTVDGDEAGATMSRLGRHISASTPQRLLFSEVSSLLDGPDKSTAVLVVEREGGRRVEAKLERSVDFWNKKGHDREGDVVRILPRGIGYVDLDRLQGDEVNGMFDKLKNTAAIIFDMRGYPNGTAWQIAPRLTEQNGPEAATFYGPVNFEPDPDGTGKTGMFYHFNQTLPPAAGFRYKGRTVMLIDERTISQAEHTGLFFEAANKTKFVGSPTAGTNGDVTNFVVPGGITIYFTRHDVRHIDGRQLQRVGLTPDVPVTPTIVGIRAGRDEVLERAVAYLSK